IGERAQLLVAFPGDPEVVFEAKSTATRPIDGRLDSQHHAFANCARSSLVCVGRLMSASSHTVADRVGWLTRISSFGDARPNQAVQFRQTRAILGVTRSFAENVQQLIKQLVILGCEITWAEILSQITPVAVHTNPDLKQRGLALLYRTSAGRGECANAFARPHQREGSRHLDFAFEPDASPVHEALEDRRDFALLHPGMYALEGVFHGERGQFIGQSHALDLLSGLDGAHL